MSKKITEQELTKIQEQQKVLNNLLNQTGVLEAQKHGILHEFARVQKEVEDNKKDLEEKYGSVSINLEDGTYTVVEADGK
jgi:hypothetical protein|tara:strand:- start:164 stop:403 length:240 start_codon:yes stop_codon:yes gene_type:complete